jgi:hypothetical protein
VSFNQDDYIGVDERLEEFFKKHPEGVVQQHSLEFREFGGKSWIVYTAAAYRTADDPRPGMGTAWEQVPGKTPFTRDSEMQNAETSAWGRALVATGAVSAKKGIASREEVQNRAASNVDPAFIPSEEANNLTTRVQNCARLDALEIAWKAVDSAKQLGVISDIEFSVLRGLTKKKKTELQKKEGATDERPTE